METQVNGVRLTYVGIIAPLHVQMWLGSNNGEDSEPPIFFHPMEILALSKILYSFSTLYQIYNMDIS